MNGGYSSSRTCVCHLIIQDWIAKEQWCLYFSKALLYLRLLSHSCVRGNTPVKKTQNVTELKRSHSHLSSPPLTHLFFLKKHMRSSQTPPRHFLFWCPLYITKPPSSLFCFHFNTHAHTSFVLFWWKAVSASEHVTRRSFVLICVAQDLILVKVDTSWCCKMDGYFVVNRSPMNHSGWLWRARARAPPRRGRWRRRRRRDFLMWQQMSWTLPQVSVFGPWGLLL